MEERLLADVLKTDTHVRVQASEELSEWMRNEENEPEAFPDLDRLVGGLAQWIGSSNHKVAVALPKKGRGCHYLESVCTCVRLRETYYSH